MRVAGVLLGGGGATRFGSPKLDATLDGVRLVDWACSHFVEGGFDPVVFVGRCKPSDPRVRVVEPGARMIESLRHGLEALPEGAFAFAPADMPALMPELLRELIEAFLKTGAAYMIPVYGVCRGHPAFAWRRELFFRHGEKDGAREIWRLVGEELQHHVVRSADVLFDIDTPEDLAAAGNAQSRHARLLARGDLRC